MCFWLNINDLWKIFFPYLVYADILLIFVLLSKNLMPIYQHKPYHPPIINNRHILTIKTALFRKMKGVEYQRERISTPDDDFLDLDWSWVKDSERVVVVLHGMEGDAGRHYVKGMIKKANEIGATGLGFNFRGCSGEPNLQLRSYHSGETADLHFVLGYIIKKYGFKKIALVGFSLGANVILKYLGERQLHYPELKIGAGISAPCDLYSTSVKLNKWYNKIYLKDFLTTLKAKAAKKQIRFPGALDYDAIAQSYDFFTYDEAYTAPAHGFDSAKAYWEDSSSLQYLPNIQLPTLLLSSVDDTFLDQPSFPYQVAKENDYFFLRTTKSGGHLGFLQRNESELYSEKIVFDFFREFGF